AGGVLIATGAPLGSAFGATPAEIEMEATQMGDKAMTRTLALALALGVGLAGAPAFAMHCPADMAKIDAALAENPDLTAEQLAEVKRLRAEGEEYHAAGQHQESVDTLARAMEILGIE